MNNEILEKHNNCIFGKIIKNPDGRIDIIKNNECSGSVDFGGLSFYTIPIKFRNIEGNFWIDSNSKLSSLDVFPDHTRGDLVCCNCPKLPYSEVCKIVDKVDGDIYYSSYFTPENKDKFRRDRDMGKAMKHDELESLDI